MSIFSYLDFFQNSHSQVNIEGFDNEIAIKQTLYMNKY